MSEPMKFLVERIATPIGELIIVTDRQESLRVVDWHDYEDRMRQLLGRHYGVGGYVLEPAVSPTRSRAALEAYFAGRLDAIEALPVATAGTAFQRSVWRALREIPCGEAISYGELARRIGNPKASRAVGSANGANQIPIVIPCHRVIAAGGKLGGFGGGLPVKEALLALENKSAGNWSVAGG
jgi:methylated-DNA-[protein]-cysteine S-methyltransferase